MTRLLDFNNLNLGLSHTLNDGQGSTARNSFFKWLEVLWCHLQHRCQRAFKCSKKTYSQFIHKPLRTFNNFVASHYRKLSLFVLISYLIYKEKDRCEEDLVQNLRIKVKYTRFSHNLGSLVFSSVWTRFMLPPKNSLRWTSNAQGLTFITVPPLHVFQDRRGGHLAQCAHQYLFEF